MSSLHRLRLHSARSIGRLVLLWFTLSLGAAIASPVVNPQAMEVVCSSAGAVKVVVKTGDGVREMGTSHFSHFDCPMCVLTGAPPPVAPTVSLPQPQPLGHALQAIPAARIAAATAAPLPARGPPSL